MNIQYDEVFPLHMACLSGHINDVKRLVEDYDVNEKDNDNQTTLHMSASNIDTDVLELLLEHGADFNVVDNKLFTPLHVATGCHYLPCEDSGDTLRARYKIFDFLIDNGVEINAKDINGRTCLHCVCQANVWKYITYFVDKGADLNVLDNEGHTALYYYKESSASKKRVKYLISQGAV